MRKAWERLGHKTSAHGPAGVSCLPACLSSTPTPAAPSNSPQTHGPTRNLHPPALNRLLVVACENKVLVVDLASRRVIELGRGVFEGRSPTCVAFLFKAGLHTGAAGFEVAGRGGAGRGGAGRGGAGRRRRGRLPALRATWWQKCAGLQARRRTLWSNTKAANSIKR